MSKAAHRKKGSTPQSRVQREKMSDRIFAKTIIDGNKPNILKDALCGLLLTELDSLSPEPHASSFAHW